TEKISERNFQENVSTQGVVEPVVHAVLSALVPGRLEELNAEEGDAVKKGTLLFRSDRKNLENACRLAEEALKAAQSRNRTRIAGLKLAGFSLEKAKRDHDRNLSMYKSKIVSSDVYEKMVLAYQRAQIEQEQARAAVSTTEAEISLAETALAIAKKKLSDSCVTAPFDGVISKKFRQENEFCNAGTPVLKLEQPGKMRICAVLNGIYYPAVKTGKTQIEISFAGKKVAVVPVSICSPSMDSLSRTFEIKADLPPEAALPSGTLCDVRVILNERRAPALPEEALLFRQNGRFAAFAVKEGKAEEIPLVPGITRDGFTEIRNAEKLRDRDFIVSGQYFVNPGTPVQMNPK
ncbi:MAG: efflux RND transporter periplasmic adaptor subunit, partial [Lentisphaeria bacterium]|nr:efflux RND transporter periplasmic adaptor subunit [Lentisphaeria bacterium]